MNHGRSRLSPRPASGLLSPTSIVRLAGLGLACFLAAADGAAQATPQATTLSESLKKIVARFPRTEEQVKFLVGRRLDPQPLPAELSNPFYRGVEPSELQQLAFDAPPEEEVPAAPDITDADTLARIAPTLRITGVVAVGGVPHVVINGSACKVGDVIPVSGRDTPVFLQVRGIGVHDLTLGLHDAEITLQVKL